MFKQKLCLSLGIIALLGVSPVWAAPHVQVKAVDHGAGKLKEALATGVIQAPREKIWQVLTDYGNYMHWLPVISKSSLQRRSGNSAIATMALNLPWPFQGTWYTNKYQEDPQNFTLQWQMIKGTLKSSTGSWTLKAQGSHTHVTYRIVTDPGVPLIPKWMVDTATKQTIPSIYEALEKRAQGK